MVTLYDGGAYLLNGTELIPDIHKGTLYGE